MNNCKTGSRYLILIASWLLFADILLTRGFAQARMEEFHGPFNSWANVKTRFGAKGDGQTDDTKAFQRALDSLSDYLLKFNQGSRGYSVIYIPRGNYKLTATLTLKGKLGIKIIGEDPTNTVLQWQGNNNDTMFWANGSAYFSLSRICWDAGGRTGMEAIGLHWKSQWADAANRSYAPVQIEFTDHIFRKGFAKGISGGTFGGKDGTGSNDSEITIKRCVFNECSESGIMIRGFNALDYWIWHCRFIKCRVGVTSSSGNYHLYSSYFKGSWVSDVYNVAGYYTSVRYCYSSGATAFSTEEGGTSNPFKRTFERNVVTNINTLGILYTHTGKITLLDNFFKGAGGQGERPFLKLDNQTPHRHYDIMDLNNSFTAFSTIYNANGPYHVFSRMQQKAKAPAEISDEQFLSAMPPAPPYHLRTVFDVPLNSSLAAIQDIINKASALGSRAIVHFSFGVYNVDKPLVIPLNSDIQIEGDGQLHATVLQKSASTGFKSGAALKVLCPSTASIRDIDFELVGNNPDNGRAIDVVNADQENAVVILDQLYAGNDTSLLVKDYDFTLFQKSNSFFTAGNYVSGGRHVQFGAGSMKVQCFGAQFANISLEHNATFIARDCWWEGAGLMPINLKGSGNFILDGAMVAPSKSDSSVTITINDFAGKVTLMDMYLIGSMTVKMNNPALQMLGWNLNFYYKKQPLEFINGHETYKAFFGGISAMCFSEKDIQCGSVIPSADRAINIGSPDGFMDTMTEDLRASQPTEYVTRPVGVTNFYLSRVTVSANYKTGIAFTK